MQALLLPGLQVSFATQMANIDAGTLVGGATGRSDFQMARDWQFSALSGSKDGSAQWFYLVGHDDPLPNCAGGNTYCHPFGITRGAYSSTEGQFRFYVDFTGGTGPFYPNVLAAYEEHKALALEGMITRTYGPIRAMSDELWDTWGLGERRRLGLDELVDGYLEKYDTQRDGALEMLADYQTEGITPAQRSRLYGFALGEGLDAVSAVGQLAADNRDYMDDDEVTRFPWFVHLNVIRMYQSMSPAEIAQLYRSVPAAKVVAVVL